jgi:hypothetical protein
MKKDRKFRLVDLNFYSFTNRAWIKKIIKRWKGSIYEDHFNFHCNGYFVCFRMQQYAKAAFTC